MSASPRVSPARSVPCLLAAALLIMVAAPARADAPARLRVTVDPPSLSPGATARVHVELLDRAFRPVQNDRDRIIRLEIRTTGGRTPGYGTVTPTQLTFRRGTSRRPVASFAATRAGTVRIWAGSDGVAAAEALVSIVPKTSSLTWWIVPVAHAQHASSFELLPSEVTVPFNRVSTAQLWIALSEVPSEPAAWRITTTAARPPRIRYREQQADGVITVRIADEIQSDAIVIEPVMMEDFDVIARRLPDGAEARVPIRMVAPTPTRVSLTTESVTLAPDQRLVPLKIGLVDSDGVAVTDLVRRHDIEVRSATSSWALDPVQVTLRPGKAADHRELTRPALSLGGTLSLIAADKAGSLERGATAVQVQPLRSALFVVALFGGLLGGLTRHVYRDRSAHLWVRRAGDRLEPGLVLNASFSGLFGLVLFQTIDLGLHTIAAEMVHGEGPFAFVLGVAGGFAGVLVIETLAGAFLESMRRALPSARRV